MDRDRTEGRCVVSRFEWDDYEPPEYENAAELFEHNVRLALVGKKGRRFLADLREALLALPEKRLIEGEFCRPKTDEATEPSDFEVCAVGAFAWWQKVKAGTDPVAAFEALPSLDEYSPFETAWAGRDAGAPAILAWEMASANDETFHGLSPEERYAKLLAWIEERLAAPEWHRGDPVPPRLGHSWATSL